MRLNKLELVKCGNRHNVKKSSKLNFLHNSVVIIDMLHLHTGFLMKILW